MSEHARLLAQVRVLICAIYELRAVFPNEVRAYAEALQRIADAIGVQVGEEET